MTAEQNYGEMNARYQDVMSAKQKMESDVLSLQAALDAERNSRSQEEQHNMELNGEAGVEVDLNQIFRYLFHSNSGSLIRNSGS